MESAPGIIRLHESASDYKRVFKKVMDQQELESLLDQLIGAVHRGLVQGDTEAVEIAKSRAVLQLMPLLDPQDDPWREDGSCGICGDPDC